MMWGAFRGPRAVVGAGLSQSLSSQGAGAGLSTGIPEVGEVDL